MCRRCRTRAIIVQQPGHDLPRRPAAGEGRDRRSRRRAEELGGGDVHSRVVRRRRPPRRRTTRTRSAIARRIVGNLNRDEAAVSGTARRRASRCYPADELYGIVPADTRTPYDVREVIARIVDGCEFDEFKALYGTTLVCGFAHIHGYPGRHPRQQRHPVLGERAQGRAFHRAVRASAASRWCSCRTSPASWSGSKYEARRHRQGWRQDGDGGRDRARAEVHRHHRRQLRRRQLRHVRPRLRPALPVDVAERAHLGDGRRAGRVGARDRAPRRPSKPRAARGRAEEEDAFKAPIRAQYETQGHPYYATARLWDDGIIDPADTRTVLGLALVGRR